MQGSQLSIPVMGKKIKKTKYYVRFINRIAHFQTDIELVDVLKCAVQNGKLIPKDGDLLFEHVDSEKHPRLASRPGTAGRREVALAHLKHTLYSSFIKDLYEDVVEYMVALVAGVARAQRVNPKRLIGNTQLSLATKDLLSCGGWDKVCELFSRDLIRQLEIESRHRKPLHFFESLDRKLDLGADKRLLDASIPYLALRHVLVHANGIPDKKFCDGYPLLGLVPGQKAPLGYLTCLAAHNAVNAMIRNFDECAVGRSHVPQDDLQG